jgi:hypothetical protein
MVSVFFGQPPASVWKLRMMAATFFASAEANQLSGLCRKRRALSSAATSGLRVRSARNSRAGRLGLG